eukprot:jgi/Bigna1/89814/estExt_fgenesh1_pg.C_560030
MSLLTAVSLAICIQAHGLDRPKGDPLSQTLRPLFEKEGGSPQDVGDSLAAVFTKYYSKPTTAAEATDAGYSAVDGKCDPYLGVAYTQGGKLSKKTPEFIYFTPGGQLAGVAVDVYGTPETSLIDAGYFVKKDEQRYHISATFRAPDKVCSSSADEMVVGDRVVLNAAGPEGPGVNYHISLNETGAISQGFSRGSCFDGMGWHYFKDISGESTSQKMKFPLPAEHLLPIVPMYHEGKLNAIFFTTTKVQQTLLPPRTNGWEPIPLPNKLMCGNWCDTDCGFSGTAIWSTQHWYFHDHTKVICPSSLHCTLKGITCCEASKSLEL